MDGGARAVSKIQRSSRPALAKTVAGYRAWLGDHSAVFSVGAWDWKVDGRFFFGGFRSSRRLGRLFGVRAYAGGVGRPCGIGFANWCRHEGSAGRPPFLAGFLAGKRRSGGDLRVSRVELLLHSDSLGWRAGEFHNDFASMGSASLGAGAKRWFPRPFSKRTRRGRTFGSSRSAAASGKTSPPPRRTRCVENGASKNNGGKGKRPVCRQPITASFWPILEKPNADIFPFASELARLTT